MCKASDAKLDSWQYDIMTITYIFVVLQDDLMKAMLSNQIFNKKLPFTFGFHQ